jgi:uncharacterized protein (TIGR02466 family)
MDSLVLFESIVYRKELPEHVDNLIKITNDYIHKARKNTRPEILKREKKYGVAIGDHGLSYHSHGKLYQDKRMADFETLIRVTAKNILESQGFDVSGHELDYTEMWVQQFADQGGGHHETHVHWDNHISGFYFLKCSDRTSVPVFHDPRPGRMMLNLPLKDTSKLCYAMERQSLKIFPGTLLMFNSYLPHEFKVDNGIDAFRFIHFNIKATPRFGIDCDI